jgi:hypothetical protein
MFDRCKFCNKWFWFRSNRNLHQDTGHLLPSPKIMNDLLQQVHHAKKLIDSRKKEIHRENSKVSTYAPKAKSEEVWPTTIAMPDMPYTVPVKEEWLGHGGEFSGGGASGSWDSPSSSDSSPSSDTSSSDSSFSSSGTDGTSGGI